jgi:hypothetical protein
MPSADGELMFVLPSQVGEVWRAILPLLWKVMKKGDVEWRPEDIRKACETGEACLFVGEDAVLVLVPREREYSKLRELYVWIAAGKGYTKHYDWLLSHAKDHGFQRIGFDSPRKGWGKRFTEGTTYYFSEV